MSEENTYTAESESIYFLNGKNLVNSLNATGKRDPIPTLDLAKREFEADRARLSSAESDITALSTEIEEKVTNERIRAEGAEAELDSRISYNVTEIARVDEKTFTFTNDWKANVDADLSEYDWRLSSLEFDTAQLSADLATESANRFSVDQSLNAKIDDTKEQLEADIAALSADYVDANGDTMTGDLVIDQANLTVKGDGSAHGGKIQSTNLSVVNNVTIGKSSTAPHDKTFVFNGTDNIYSSKGVGTVSLNPINGYAGIFVGDNTVSTLIESERSKTVKNIKDVSVYLDGRDTEITNSLTQNIKDVSAYLDGRDHDIETSLTATQKTVGDHYTEFGEYVSSNNDNVAVLSAEDASIRTDFAAADAAQKTELEGKINQVRTDFSTADAGLKALFEAADASLSGDIDNLRTDAFEEINAVKQNLVGSVRYRGHLTISNSTAVQALSALIINHKHYAVDEVLENGIAFKFSVDTASGKYVTTDGIELTDNDYVIVDNHAAPFSVVVSQLNRETVDIVKTLDSDVVRQHALLEVSANLKGQITTAKSDVEGALALSVSNLTTKINTDVGELRSDILPKFKVLSTAVDNAVLSSQENGRKIDALSASQMSAMVFDGIIAFDPSTISQHLLDTYGITDTNLSSLFKAANLGDRTYRKIKGGYSYFVRITSENDKGEKIYTTEDGVYLSDNDLIIIDTVDDLKVENISPSNIKVVHSDRADNVRMWQHYELSSEMIDRVENETSRALSAEGKLSEAIDTEISARTTADKNLQTSIDTEISARGIADKKLSSAIDTEISARTEADTTINGAINNIEDELDTVATRLDGIDALLDSGSIGISDEIINTAEALYQDLYVNYDTNHPDGVSIDDLRLGFAQLLNVIRTRT